MQQLQVADPVDDPELQATTVSFVILSDGAAHTDLEADQVEGVGNVERTRLLAVRARTRACATRV